jgi:DNA-binding SARP family transcriptional activator
MDSALDILEIRLLGPLRIRRPSGSVVDVRDLRTGKTADLLRMLALRGEDPLGVETVLEELWPDVDRAKGLVSLRTATSQIRRALGQNCVVHQYDGLRLTSAWVDVLAFKHLAFEAHAFAAERQWDKTVAIAREADGLYLDDIRAHDPQIETLSRARQSLRDLHLAVLLDAADAAVNLRWYRDGVDFAGRALTTDPYSERATRALMLAHAGLGETQPALIAFDRCRRRLASELGADPSAQTQAVHLQVLGGKVDRPLEFAFVGRADTQAILTTRIRQCLSSQEPGLVVVSGAEGLGKSALIDQTLASLTVTVAAADCGSSEGTRARDHLKQAHPGAELVLVLDNADQLADAELTALCDDLLGRRGPVAVLAVMRSLPRLGDGPLARLQEFGRVSCLPLSPLRRTDIGELARQSLAGRAGDGLIERLWIGSAGNPLAARQLLASWVAEGQIVSRSEGLEFVSRPEVAAGLAAREWMRIHEQLPPEILDVLAAMAVMGVAGEPSTVAALMPAIGAQRVAEHLQHLADLLVLAVVDGGYSFRTPWLRDQVLSWLRPSERRRLHAVIAQDAPCSDVRRIRHWLAAGDPARAVTEALRSAADALEADDPESAYEQLDLARAAAERPESEPEQRLGMLELLGDAATALHRDGEAVTAYRAALALARRHAVTEVDRIETKMGRARGRSAVRTPSPRDSLHIRELAQALDWDPFQPATPEQVHELRRSLSRADRCGDTRAQVGYRLLLADAVLTPQRSLRESRQLAQEARSLSTTPIERAMALVVMERPAVLLGDSARAWGPLQDAWQVVRHCDNVAAKAQVGVLACLAAHDLGHRDLDVLWPAVLRIPPASLALAGGDWLVIRVLGDRAEFSEALRASRSPSPTPRSLNGQFSALSMAMLQRQMFGADEVAGVRFGQVASDAIAAGCQLIAPEAQTWMAESFATADSEAAVSQLDEADAIAAAVYVGRERCARLLARAAIQAAQGNLAAACEISGYAASTARTLGLVYVQARALSALAGYLALGGREQRSQQAARHAGRLLRRSGASTAIEHLLPHSTPRFERVTVPASDPDVGPSLAVTARG